MSGLGKLKSAASVVALMTAVAVTPAFAEELTDEVAAQTDAAISETVQNEANAQVDEKRNALIADATEALEKTEEALTALDEGDTQAAIDALALATGKLETVVAREPDLALAPVSVRLIQRDLMGDVEAVESARETIEELVDDGRLQQARPLMRDFASEIIVETTNLPLATYPDALVTAAAQIDDGEFDVARQTLATALSTVVVTEDTISLPILRAERFIDEAETALGGQSAEEETSAGEDDEALTLTPSEYVQAAREQLDLAEALGYGTEDDFAELHADLERLDEQIEAEEDTGGILDTIRQSFDRFKDRFFTSET
ncbi:YfdX family protein [Leisingera aquaemixtae]|uniref:YfdX protein n=1 Tax=Leisingera aquaemixtae TaxID=1396826 RepID=A0A0P1HSR4_9RHOB|nr:YfdX family protein [Leisingera aquaemixtae]CUI01784.1 YfdX protein [Leisingera aquaemixtae]